MYLVVARRVAHDLPLEPGGEAGAAHASQLAGLEAGDEGVGVAAGRQLARRPVALAGAVGIDVERAGIADDRVGADRRAGGGRGHGVHERVGGHARDDDVVDRAGRRPIAASQAGGSAHHGARRRRARHALLRLGEQRDGAAPVAREVVAHQAPRRAARASDGSGGRS